MENRKNLWDIYKNDFMKRDVTIKQIKDYFWQEYGIKIREYKLDEMKPYSRWKSKLDKKIDDDGLKNIVYIKSYLIKEDKHGKVKSRPIICGVTKTGKYGTIDFNFNLNDNKDGSRAKITGRGLMREEGFKYDEKVIYLFGCKDENDAFLLERVIQNKFNLFGS